VPLRPERTAHDHQALTPRTTSLVPWACPELLEQLAARIKERRLGRDDLLFATLDGTPISRNTFRTRVWAPAVKARGVDFNVRIHDLRHAHASWLLTRRVASDATAGGIRRIA
jgi:integrase